MKQERELAWTRNKIRVLVIAGPESVSDWMASVISTAPDLAFMGLVRDLAAPVDYLDKLAPDVILVDISSGILEMGDLINSLSTPSVTPAIIIVAMMNEVDSVRQAMLHGAQGFLLKPFSEAALLSSIRQANELMIQRRAQVAALPVLPAAKVEPRLQARVVAIYSPKGGVGCTTIATNLAVALKNITRKRVTLVDADLLFGDVDSALNIPSGPSIATVVSKLDEMDDQFLEQSLAAHRSGVKVLAAPPYLDMADTIRPDQIAHIISRLAALGDGYLIVDTWSTLNDITLAILDTCDSLIIITTPQVTALRDLHRFLEALNLLHYDPGKVLLVLNHSYQPNNVKRSEVERVLGWSIVQEIAHAPQQVASSLNRGVPLVQEYEESPAARDLVKLARRLVELDKDAAGKSRPGSRPTREALPANHRG
jgi:pilus assembly protein CpaE